MSFTIKQVIDENEHYQLAVVQLPDVPVDVYGVVNKQYNVCEMSVSVLPQAKESFAQFTKWITEEATRGLPDMNTAAPNGLIS